MYQLQHNITFDNAGRKFKLQLLHSVEIKTSSENLVDTAIIILPESVFNSVLNFEDKIGRGTKVTIELGYDQNLVTEFVGFIVDVVNNGGTLSINCEDALFLFRKSVPDKVFKPAPVRDVLQYLIDQIDPSYKLVMDADYGITYEKFTVYQAEGYDVLKKIQEELKANIYFDTAKKELHFKAPFKEEGGVVKYDMSKNVETSSLEFKKSSERKLEVTVESTSTDGTLKQVVVGTPGGEKINMKVGAMSEGDMRKVAETALNQRNADRYEGNITTWLVPFVAPTFRAKFKDLDYPKQDGAYYVKSVDTSFSDGGGKRTVTFGIKL